MFEQAGFKVNTVSIEGEPGRKIADFAHEGGYDQIVIGSRGTGALTGLASGSVTQKVLYFANCPVTVIKGEDRSYNSARSGIAHLG
ncbi:MAG TPA: universal stress protein [Desulfotomaculum sp.]|nr:universal stress protein [Desulfotomaculum sp.]